MTHEGSRTGRITNALLHRVVKADPTAPRTIASLREGARKMDAVFGAYNTLTRAERHWGQRIHGGVPCLTRQTDSAAPYTLLHLHGGSFAMFARRSYVPFLNDMAKKLNANVIMPDYRLAPEHPFPAGVEDCHQTYTALLDAGVPPSKIVITGDSAGGNLALALMVLLHRKGLPLPAALWTVSAPVDLTFKHLSDAEMDAMDKIDAMLSKSTLGIISQYVSNETATANPLASPLLAASETPFPPTRLDAGTHEFLYKDPTLFQSTAQHSQIEAKLWPGMPHAFSMFGFLPEARASRREAAAFLQTHLNAAQTPAPNTAQQTA